MGRSDGTMLFNLDVEDRRSPASHVDAIVKSPPSDAIVTQAFTSPFAVIAVKTKAPGSVRWNP